MIYPQTEAISDTNFKKRDWIKLSDCPFKWNFRRSSYGCECGCNAIVFIAMIALVNGLFGALGKLGASMIGLHHTTYESLSVEFLLGYLFAPLIWLLSGL